MSLPDVSRLAAAPPATLRAFAHKLTDIGVDLDAASPVVSAVASIDPALRAPARAFLLRTRRDPVGFVLRMFLFNDPVTPDEAKLALGDMTDELEALGLLERSNAGVVSPFVLGIVNKLYLLSDVLDRGRDGVMGLAHTTVALVRATHPTRPLKRALELGCGAGLGALALATAVSQVVATDINPRAVALARINAAINGITNVDFRVGDRFAPVEGESFDLILSQPPFVARPPNADGGSAIYGGARGDELALSVVSGIPKHLARGGRAVLLVQWPETGEAPLADRLRSALGAGPNLLVLRSPAVDVLGDVTSYAAAAHPTLGAGFAADVTARLAHLAEAGVLSLTPSLVIVERAAEQGGGGGWTASMPIGPMASVAITSARVDALLAGHALLGREARLLATKLRVPEGTVLSQTQVGPGAEVPSTLSARFSPEAASEPLDLSMEDLGLMTLIHEAETVEAAIPRCMELFDLPHAEARAMLLALARGAVGSGLLAVV